jgi:lysophospholipase L1-like esterase
MTSFAPRLRSRRLRGLACLLAVSVATIAGNASAALAADPAERWLPAMERFDQLDREAQPKPGGILFLGSSSIRMWDVEEWFPDLPVLNRGFGGSQISDSLYFFDRLVSRYAPHTLVFYAGDNDVAAGESPEQVSGDFEAFLARVHQRLPDCHVIFVAIKPSLARWSLVEPMREVNRAVEQLAKRDARLDYLDVDGPMLTADGEPRPELFVDDGLHLNSAGYELWTQLLRPLLSREPQS